MKKIVAVNGSPRTVWNTGALVREAAKGAESMGAEVTVFAQVPDWSLVEYNGTIGYVSSRYLQ